MNGFLIIVSTVIALGVACAVRAALRRHPSGIGASGSFKGAGTALIGASLTAYNTPSPMPVTQALRTVSVDTTQNRAIGVGAAWGTSSASNSITTYNLMAWAAS